MNTSIYLTLKYWKKHLKNALALLFSGTLTVTVITVFWLIKREDVNRDIQNRYYSHGRYQVIAGNSYDEFNEKLTEGRDDIQHGRFNVLGELGGSQKFAYGTIEDEYDLAYIPLESGRLPESGNELAADRGALDRLFWVGKCGDTITFDGNTYTVVGIIDERYGKFRTGSQLNEYNSYSGHELPLFIVGESEKEPLYRIDFFGGLLDVNKTSAEQEEEINQYWDCCYHTLGTEEHWFNINFEGKSEELEWLNEFNTVEKKDVEAFLALFVIGALISVLSVFSVLRGIFAERQSNIMILKRIGDGITDIVLSNAKIGALIKLPFDCEELLKYIVCDEEMPYNFLTTADGAKAMGFQCAAYTEIYSSEKINGGLIPFSAEMQLVSKSLLERNNFIKKIAQYAGSIALLTVMSLLGFSAYFNGIGMKIRQKKYEISAVRAVGARIMKVKKYLLLDSLKIPFFASVITYILFKPMQIYANQTADRIDSAMRTDMELYRQLLDNFPINRKNWWQPNLEIPMLILFLALCAVTFLLTAKALKSFNSDIAGNLSEGRTRQ